MRRGFTPILILLVVAISIIGAVIYQQLAPKTQPQSQAQSNSPSPSLFDAGSAPSGAGETANWKTYENKEFGFSIKYPQSWVIYDNDTPPCAGQIYQYVFVSEYNKPEYALEHCSTGNLLPVADLYILVTQQYPLPKTSKEQIYTPYNISGENGVINFDNGYYTPLWGPARIATSIFVNHNNKSYEINFPNTDYKGTHDPVYDQILSTFQFLD